jgi:site-specific DNA-methyltransferase (adenine-specific)
MAVGLGRIAHRFPELALGAPSDPMIEIHAGDNLEILRRFAGESFDLIYIDPPFNTGRKQARTQMRTVRDDNGHRVGFRGDRFRNVRIGRRAFEDSFDDYLAFLEPRLEEAHRLLRPAGSFFLHIDYREVHYAKVLLDAVFGRSSFMNEIIWAYDYGARAKRKWSPKHDNILWYAKNPDRYTFNYGEIDRIPYMAPGLVGPEKAARGKTPTDTWWNTIVSPTGKEKTGYPTQKPLAIVERIVRVHSNPGDRLLDFFAGSGTLGVAAARLGRDAVLVDCNPEAIEVMRSRFAGMRDVRFVQESLRRGPETGMGGTGGLSVRGEAPTRSTLAGKLPAPPPVEVKAGSKRKAARASASVIR